MQGRNPEGRSEEASLIRPGGAARGKPDAGHSPLEGTLRKADYGLRTWEGRPQRKAGGAHGSLYVQKTAENAQEAREKDEGGAKGRGSIP